MQICIYEDTYYTRLFPLVYLHPVYELRCGIFSLREKIEHFFPRAKIALHTRPQLLRLVAEENPGTDVNRLEDAPTWFINGRVVADEELGKIVRSRHRDNVVYHHDGEVVAAFVTSAKIKTISRFLPQLHDRSLFQDIPQRTTETSLVKYPWDLIRLNQREIENDSKIIRGVSARKNKPDFSRNVCLMNRRNIHLGKGVRIQPGVVLDAEQGPIVIGKNARVMPNAVIQGPAYIGEDSLIKIGAKLYPGTSVGKVCKVGGEIDGSILHSYTNKQHDGFLGHSYLGSWVNLGADTNTSDLKNTYGPVTVLLEGTSHQTGMQFLGMIMGDHSKTGINVMLNTGTIIGVSCNIFGAELPPKYLPSFSWGRGTSFETYEIDKSLEIARRVMARRGVSLTDSYELVFRELFQSTSALRNQGNIR
jgi:UDP-N-acetylglucosamine diphosphorylase/glucosamine-1-phosphate N-acetyltransferase